MEDTERLQRGNGPSAPDVAAQGHYAPGEAPPASQSGAKLPHSESCFTRTERRYEEVQEGEEGNWSLPSAQTLASPTVPSTQRGPSPTAVVEARETGEHVSVDPQKSLPETGIDDFSLCEGEEKQLLKVTANASALQGKHAEEQLIETNSAVGRPKTSCSSRASSSEAKAEKPPFWEVVSDSRVAGSGPLVVSAKESVETAPSAVSIASQAAATLLAAAKETAVAALATVTEERTSAAPSDAARTAATIPLAGEDRDVGYTLSGTQGADMPSIDILGASVAMELTYNSNNTNGPSTTEAAGAEDGDDDLPAFANEENIALHQEIKEKQRLLSRQETETGQKTERVNLMRQHLRQLQTEAAQLEALAAAKETHIRSDKHIQGVALRHISKLKSEMRNQQQEQQQIQALLTGLQLDIARGQEQIDSFKLRMKWNEEELAQWRSAARQKEVRLPAFVAAVKRFCNATCHPCLQRLIPTAQTANPAKRLILYTGVA